MGVYNPTGSGNVHIDRVISGGRKGGAVAKGMGFKAAAASVAKKSGVSKKAANAIIAAGARKASLAAKKANPNLKKVIAKKAAKKATTMSEAPVQLATTVVKPTKRQGRMAVPSKRQRAAGSY